MVPGSRPLDRRLGVIISQFDVRFTDNDRADPTADGHRSRLGSAADGRVLFEARIAATTATAVGADAAFSAGADVAELRVPPLLPLLSSVSCPDDARWRASATLSLVGR